MTEVAITAFATLFVVIDPMGNLPIVGARLLDLLGIGIPAFRTAGGLMSRGG